MSWDDMFSQSEESKFLVMIKNYIWPQHVVGQVLTVYSVFLPFNYLNVARFKNETIYLIPGLGL